MSGLISVSAPPSTRATCDFLYFSASVTASPRLSSSRNCENSGANLRVSPCALRRSHHFLMVTDSDQMDMMARVNTMPRANPPIWFQRSSSESCIVSGSPMGVGYLSSLNWKLCCTSCFTLCPVSYTHLRAHETDSYLVCRLLLEKK